MVRRNYFNWMRKIDRKDAHVEPWLPQIWSPAQLLLYKCSSFELSHSKTRLFVCFLDLESIPNFAVYLHTICHSSNFPLLSSPTTIKIMDNRRKVRLHSVRDIISHTPPADDAVKFRITSKRRRALRVGTHRRR